MVRVKRGKTAHKKREKLLKYTKGFNWGRKSKERAAKEALLHAWSHAYDDRKKKKRDNRGLWQVKINAASRESGISYSKLINQLKKKNININRKVLSELAVNHPNIFAAIVKEALSE
jgi:large subunit ribosomal protein L20